jgi:hypothetical protein
MRKLLLLVFLFPLLSSKCKDDPKPISGCNSILKLNFKPIINNQPFITNKIYVINGRNVRFSKFQFYASSINVQTAGTAQICNLNDEVIFIDFNQLDDSIKSVNGVNALIPNLNNGDYDSFTINFGVNEKLNSKLPADFPSSNPLSKSEEYWSNWKSYIFFKLEGLIDKDGDGVFETGITYHTGSNAANYSLSYSHNFKITSSENKLNIELNINELIGNFNFNTTNKIENLSQISDMKRLMTNLAFAISIK